MIPIPQTSNAPATAPAPPIKTPQHRSVAADYWSDGEGVEVSRVVDMVGAVSRVAEILRYILTPSSCNQSQTPDTSQPHSGQFFEHSPGVFLGIMDPAWLNLIAHQLGLLRAFLPFLGLPDLLVHSGKADGGADATKPGNDRGGIGDSM